MAQFSGSTYSAAVDESKRLIALAMLGITKYDFDKTTNKLTLYMQDGTVVEAALTADSSPGTVGEAWTTNITNGGIQAGTNIKATDKIVDVLKNLTTTYLQPVINSFSGSSALLNCIGDVVAGTTLTASVTKRSESIVSVKFLKNGTVLATDTSKPNGGSYSYAYGQDITTDTVFKIEINDGKSTVSKTVEYKFISPMYYGMTSAVTPTQADILGLTKLVATKANKELSYTGVNKRATFAYPASYGALLKIEDQNAFDNTSGFTKSTVNVNGVQYNVYQSGAATLNNFKYVFKFS